MLRDQPLSLSQITFVLEQFLFKDPCLAALIPPSVLPSLSLPTVENLRIMLNHMNGISQVMSRAWCSPDKVFTVLPKWLKYCTCTYLLLKGASMYSHSTIWSMQCCKDGFPCISSSDALLPYPVYFSWFEFWIVNKFLITCYFTWSLIESRLMGKNWHFV